MMKRGEDGMYTDKDGKKYKFLIGSRAQVMHGTAYKTSGNLIAGDLMKSKSSDKIVSVTRSKIAKKENRLGKAGYTARKGKFGAVKISTRKRRSSKSKTPERQKIFGIFK